MNKIQEKNVTLSVSMFNELGWWQGNKDEFVSAGTALGAEYTQVIYLPSTEGKIGRFDTTTQTWTEVTNNVLIPFWDSRGMAFGVDLPDADFPDWAIFEQPPEHNQTTHYVTHNGEEWDMHAFDNKELEPEETTEPEQEGSPPVELTKAEKARAYLASTDWYVTRKLETSTAIPKEVSLNRDKCRAVLETNLPNTDFLYVDD